eukprot:511625_1
MELTKVSSISTAGDQEPHIAISDPNNITPEPEKQRSVSPEVALQRHISSVFPNEKRWQFFHRFLIFVSFIGPATFTISWLYALYASPWKIDETSVSRVLAHASPQVFATLIVLTLITCISLIILVLARNIQCQVIFVLARIGNNEHFEWSFIWRYLNLISTILSYIGLVSLILLLIFDAVVYPTFHLLFAILTICGIGFYELLHAVITFRHRLHQYMGNEISIWYFVDSIYFSLVVIGEITGLAVYLDSVSIDPNVDATAQQSGWLGEWLLFLFMVEYFIMLSWTLNLDSTRDELELFAKHSYYFVIGDANLSIKAKRIHDAKQKEKQNNEKKENNNQKSKQNQKNEQDQLSNNEKEFQA